MIWISVAVLQFYNVPILPVRRFGDVRQVPIADMPASFEQFVGAQDQNRGRNLVPNRLGGLEIDYQFMVFGP
ncbi:MAG: hypothetical protein WAK39_23470 [Pseudolabrys sp.]|jgi:hypothetical protein